MSSDTTDGPLSDDEIYFGQLSHKEVIKRLFWNDQLKLCTVSAVNSPRKYDAQNDSLRILQTHSEPNLLCKDSLGPNSSESVNPGWDMNEDDSFIKLENMVENLCVSPTPQNNKKTEELNNTLEVIEYILNNPPSKEQKPDVVTDRSENAACAVKAGGEVLSELCLKKLQNISPQKNRQIANIAPKDSPEPPRNTPVKNEKIYKEAGYLTPLETKSKHIFKTPAQPLSLKKPSATSLKKTPSNKPGTPRYKLNTPTSKTNSYQHISSPVASYIKNCPIVPLVKDIHPKKPLPGMSSIPKFKNHVPVKPSNKENVNLPSVAYKSAKKTTLIDMPDEQKLPQSQWAKKIMTSLPRPVVIKHDHREMNFAKRKLLPQQEDSFADLSYHQAEVSVCTQKTAFKTKKN